MKAAESELWRVFGDAVRRHPRKAMVLAAEDGRSWRGGDLMAHARKFAGEAGLGAARGGCVAFSLATSPEWLRTFLALQAAGAAAMPLDPEPSAPDGMTRAGAAGATHFLDDAKLVPLRPAKSAMDWRRFVYAKLTSGSTGAPGVIPCRASHLLADGANVIRSMRIRAADRNLAILPLGHSYGLGNLVMPLILQGTGVVTAAGYLPRQVLEWIDAHRVTVLPAVPVVLEILAGAKVPARSGSLRLVISAGAPLSAEVARRFLERFGVRVHNFYGSSETGGICFDRTGAASLAGRSVGRTMVGVSVRVMRRGRIRVSGPAVAVGGGRFTLADLGEWTPAGELRIVGRASRVANIGGRKVSPAEVEAALAAIPGVGGAWVDIHEEDGRDRIVAAVESGLPAAAIFLELEARLAKWKRPRRLEILPRLPRNARGKLDAAALRRLFDQGRSTGTK